MKPREVIAWVGEHKLRAAGIVAGVVALAGTVVGTDILLSKPVVADRCENLPLTTVYKNPLMNQTERTLLGARCQIETLLSEGSADTHTVQGKGFRRLIVSSPDFVLAGHRQTYQQIEMTVSDKTDQITSATIREAATSPKFVLRGAHKSGWMMIVLKQNSRDWMMVQQYNRLSDGEADPVRAFPLVDIKPKKAVTLEAKNYDYESRLTVAEFGRAMRFAFIHAKIAHELKNE